MTLYSNEVEDIFNKLSNLRAFILKDDPNKNDSEDYDKLSEWEISMLKSDIQSKLAHGWYAIEIYEYLQNSEYINSILDEDIAIIRMTKVYEQVIQRINNISGLDKLNK